MTDILIRDVPDEVLAGHEAEYPFVYFRTADLRRALERERVQESGPVTVDGFERFSQLAADLDDPTVMSDAWS